MRPFSPQLNYALGKYRENTLTYINECKAPDLTKLPISAMNRAAMMWFFSGQGPKEKKTVSLVTSYIMIVNKTLREYNEAREKLILYINSSNQTLLFIEALGCFENCLISSKRAFRLIHHMNRDKYTPINRVIKRFLDANSLEVTAVRDNIEHIDEKILKGIDDYGAHSLITTKDGDYLEICNSKIKFTTLANILTKFNDISLFIANHDYSKEVEHS